MFQKNPGVEKVFALPEEDITIFCQVVARFPVDSFMSHSTEFFVGAPFNVSENFGYRNILFMMGWYHVFPSNFFSISKYRNTSWGTLLCFRNCLVWNDCMNRRGFHDFMSIYFRLTVPKVCVGNLYVFQKRSGMEVNYE